MAAAASASFLALRGAAEDLSASAAARPGGAWADSVVALRKARGNPAARAAMAVAYTPPSRFGNTYDKKKRDDTASLPIPLPFDPLGVSEAAGDGGGGGLYLWGPEGSDTKKASTSRRRGGGDDRPPVSVERLDRWIRGSVTEIVKQIEEAPFLSFIFANDEEITDACRSNSSLSCSSAVRIERNAAVEAEDWPAIQRRWGSNSPDGVILVEELKNQQQLEKEAKDSSGFASGLSSAATRTWGVLVQGRGGGADCTACYVLNTCRVLSAGGCCTHFCLVRAECSGESAEAQLRKAWLAYGNRYWQ